MSEGTPNPLPLDRDRFQRLLGAYLRTLRESSGMSPEQVAGEFPIFTAEQLLSAEKGEALVPAWLFCGLLRLYRVDAVGLHATLISIVRQAASSGD